MNSHILTVLVKDSFKKKKSFFNIDLFILNGGYLHYLLNEFLTILNGPAMSYSICALILQTEKQQWSIPGRVSESGRGGEG